MSAHRTPCGVTLRRVGRAYRVESPCCGAVIRARRCSECGMGLPAAGVTVEPRRLPSVIVAVSAAYGRTCPDPYECGAEAERRLLAAEG